MANNYKYKTDDYAVHYNYHIEYSVSTHFCFWKVKTWGSSNEGFLSGLVQFVLMHAVEISLPEKHVFHLKGDLKFTKHIIFTLLLVYLQFTLHCSSPISTVKPFVLNILLLIALRKLRTGLTGILIRIKYYRGAGGILEVSVVGLDLFGGVNCQEH